MENLREEINQMLDIFEFYGFPEEQQKYLIVSGITFGYPSTHSEYTNLDCFEFADLLRFCKKLDGVINVNDMIKNNLTDESLDIVKFYRRTNKKNKVKTLEK